MSVYEAIEAFAAEQGWVVKYSSDGTPNFFYPIYKCKSSDLDPSLPDHTHPAFIVNGAEIDRRLIAVYKGSSIVSGGAIHSLPMMAPAVSAGADALLSRIKQTGAGFGPKTVADSGLLLLLARKNDWVPHGNNAWSCDYRDVAAWDINANMTVGTKRGYHGYIWECISAHTSALENRPDISPKLWKRGKRVGGVPVASQIGSATSDEKYRGYNTLTGSGPASWRLDGTPSGIGVVYWEGAWITATATASWTTSCRFSKTTTPPTRPPISVLPAPRGAPSCRIRATTASPSLRPAPAALCTGIS